MTAMLLAFAFISGGLVGACLLAAYLCYRPAERRAFLWFAAGVVFWFALGTGLAR